MQEKETMEKLLSHLPYELGIHRTYKGYYYLIEALTMAQEQDGQILFISKTIFPVIAGKYHTSIGCIERDIRTVINACWKSEKRQLLQQITPYPLVKAPTVREFLDILYLRFQEELEEARQSDL